MRRDLHGDSLRTHMEFDKMRFGLWMLLMQLWRGLQFLREMAVLLSLLGCPFWPKGATEIRHLERTLALMKEPKA